MDKHPREDTLLEKLKTLVPNNLGNSAYDSTIEFALDKTVNDVSNYIHIAVLDLPEQLDTTILSMCYQLMFTHELLAPNDQGGGTVSSISEGDTSVSFKTPGEVFATLQTVNSVTDDYVSQLNSFRVVLR